MRARLRFSKGGALRFVSHLDLSETIHRLIRRSGAPIAYSHGFNPQPRIALSPPLPLGFEALGELADVLLLERIDLKEWLRALRAMPVGGLEWTGAEEIELRAPSIQQAIRAFDYRIDWRRWGNEPPSLPLERAAVERAVAEFMSSAEWPVELARKGETQRRDARAFMAECEVAQPAQGYEIGLRMRIRSENGATLSPLVLLESLFGASNLRCSPGLLLHVARLPLNVS